MALSPSADRLGDEEAVVLLDLADDAVADGLRGQAPRVPDLAALPRPLQELRGVFVTLTVGGELNGCIGTIEPREPLGLAVGRLARSAAFADPRLPPLLPSDYGALTIEVSVLSPLEPVDAPSRADLLAQLRPGVDGLVLAAGHHQGVFLPAVWDKLPEPDAFLDHLLRKAGLRPGTWPSGLRAHRFTVEKLSRRAGDRSTPSRAA